MEADEQLVEEDDRRQGDSWLNKYWPIWSATAIFVGALALQGCSQVEMEGGRERPGHLDPLVSRLGRRPLLSMAGSLQVRLLRVHSRFDCC